MDTNEPATPPASGDAPSTATGTGDTPAAPPSDTPAAADTATPPADSDAGDTPAIEYTDFTMPEGVEIDGDLLAEVTPLFKQDGLTQEQAQRYIDKYADRIKAMNDGAGDKAEKWFAERLATEKATRIETDLVALKADQEIGGNNFGPVKAQVMEFVGTLPAAFREMADTQGLSNNPEFVRAIYRAIHYSVQDRGESGAGGGGSNPLPSEAVLYPNEAKK